MLAGLMSFTTEQVDEWKTLLERDPTKAPPTIIADGGITDGALGNGGGSDGFAVAGTGNFGNPIDPPPTLHPPRRAPLASSSAA